MADASAISGGLKKQRSEHAPDLSISPQLDLRPAISILADSGASAVAGCFCVALPSPTCSGVEYERAACSACIPPPPWPTALHPPAAALPQTRPARLPIAAAKRSSTVPVGSTAPTVDAGAPHTTGGPSATRGSSSSSSSRRRRRAALGGRRGCAHQAAAAVQLLPHVWRAHGAGAARGGRPVAPRVPAVQVRAQQLPPRQGVQRHQQGWTFSRPPAPDPERHPTLSPTPALPFTAPAPASPPPPPQLCGLPEPAPGGGLHRAARGPHPAVPPRHRAAARSVDRAGRRGPGVGG